MYKKTKINKIKWQYHVDSDYIKVGDLRAENLNSKCGASKELK